MKDFMKKVVMKEKKLNQEERNLLSVAYKNVVGARRASWRVLSTIAMKENENKSQLDLTQMYKKRVEKELTDICNDVLSLLGDVLLKNSTISPEEKVFYFKMQGDYLRYMSEYDNKDEIIEDAKFAYQAAYDAAKPLKSTDPIKLGLALNFSVFYYEIQDDHKKACELAKSAFDTAVTRLENLTEEEYKDATLIMQLLRDNLTLWQSENDDEPPVENDGTTVRNIA
jgi:hypothetical protein